MPSLTDGVAGVLLIWMLGLVLLFGWLWYLARGRSAIKISLKGLGIELKIDAANPSAGEHNNN